ncbi:response regulator [Tautonia plasticadhaerens]|uniref:Putative transcriptional regulatory protein NarL n=1 Tax=Tautonia plasticadhaerens TaxID=2527974 RepID=A0A518H0B5_9BACT|nr:response regulator [Tautonia plasticadhaerens]QDV34280.1 putative transcriptional regulatory protein NarL [Tautonia plasticadhaerens]
MTPPDPISISIVLADDDADLRLVAAGRLRASGMTVWEACDGAEALRLVREHRPTVLVLDLWMPGVDGLQVLDALRFDPVASRLAVVVLTGDGEADGRLLALAGGAASILLKGGSIDALVGEVLDGAARALGPPFGVDLGDDGGLASCSTSHRDPIPSGPDRP